MYVDFKEPVKKIQIRAPVVAYLLPYNIYARVFAEPKRGLRKLVTGFVRIKRGFVPIWSP